MYKPSMTKGKLANWRYSMWDMLLNLFTGSFLGVLGGIANAWIAYKQKKADQEHELKVIREERETRKVEAEMQMQVTQEEFSGKAFLVSQEAGNKTLMDTSSLKALLKGGWMLRIIGGFLALLMGLLEIGRSAVRPGITLYLLVIFTNIIHESYKMQGGIGLETRNKLVVDGVHNGFQLLNMCVSWWFGYRMTIQMLNKR
jgi:hypothetical protein